MNYDSAHELFSKYSIRLSAEQYEKLALYAELLQSEGLRQNVTTVDDPDIVWTRHFLDAAFLTAVLPQNASVIDIGTGGGIPGIPLAVLREDLNLTLLDSELRKIEFCKSVSESMHLKIQAIAGRAEELAHLPEYREQYDCAVSRAMAAGSMLTELSLPFIKSGGMLIAMKGRGYSPDTEPFDTAAKALLAEEPEITPYILEGEQKYLITVRKQEPTPAQYPRRFARIKRNPL